MRPAMALSRPFQAGQPFAAPGLQVCPYQNPAILSFNEASKLMARSEFELFPPFSGALAWRASSAVLRFSVSRLS
jgi:hypothetical protein